MNEKSRNALRRLASFLENQRKRNTVLPFDARYMGGVVRFDGEERSSRVENWIVAVQNALELDGSTVARYEALMKEDIAIRRAAQNNPEIHVAAMKWAEGDQPVAQGVKRLFRAGMELSHK